MEIQPRPAFPGQIETERLILRAPREGDGVEVNAAVRETYADLHEWMEWADHLPEVEETQQRRQEALAKFVSGEDFSVLAYLRTTDVLVVGAGLHPLDWKVPRFEIGYWCRAAYQGQGYVTETVRALTYIGFEVFGAHRIEIRCDARNLRSRRVAEQAGYFLEATLKNHRVAPDGKLRDTLIYTLFPEEYARLSLKR
jgi:RimJ/RimL family protein N-acetyltransferase